MALYFNRYKKLRIPRPINYLFSGRIISERFKKIKRNNFLDNKNSIVGLSKGFKKKINFTHKNVFLVLISHPSETKLIFKWLSKIPNKNYYFIFRFPPSVKKKKFINIINNEKNFTISNNNRLIDDCRKSKYAIFSNTSAGLEAVNLGLVSIRIKTYNVNTSPLEKNHEKNFFCSSNFEDFKKIFIILLNSTKSLY